MNLTNDAKMALSYYAGATAMGAPPHAVQRGLIDAGLLTPAGVITDKGREVEAAAWGSAVEPAGATESTGHTPGRWSYEAKFGEVHDAQGGTIASVEHDAHADGALMAAAPDLLEAAAGVLRMFDAYGSGNVPAREVHLLREAIEKATRVPS